MNPNLISFIYLVAGVLFILGIKGLTKPKTAVRGNMLSALGMLLAVTVTLITINDVDYRYIVAGVVVGSLVGSVMALRIQMTSMPQMVALLNGFGGGASLTIALAEYFSTLGVAPTSFAGSLVPVAIDSSAFGVGAEGTFALAAIGLTVMIGALTLTGSFIAFAKLQELMKKSYGLPGGPIGNAILVIGALAAVVYLVVNPGNMAAMLAIVTLALLLGLFLVMPIGGADMPVVIALLNSYSGIAAALAGFILGNTVLIVAGSLVGTSGLIPGYGMAMAQAQHAVRELADAMEAKGIEVEYGIHPVAGRMPGHMNVLLAEAEVPYDKLVEMDRINPTFEDTDVVIIIGANDVTNPMARESEGSPIYGMPILNVDKARNVIVIKRSLSPGFAGLPNPLFAMDHTLMVYGDGKKAVVEMTTALNQA